MLAGSEGAALARALLEKTDVLVENFKVGRLGKYALDYQSFPAEGLGACGGVERDGSAVPDGQLMPPFRPARRSPTDGFSRRVQVDTR